MIRQQDCTFEKFVALRKQDLQRIARHTKGEHRFGDVVGEAWLLAHDLSTQGKLAGDLLDPSAQNLLLSYLYQKLVRYTDQHVRHAIRLDHPARDGDEDGPHPLVDMLVSDNDSDVLAELIERENASLQQTEPDVHHCLASAYVYLLRHFNNRMAEVAEYLLISVSHAYRCCARARLLAACQNPISIASTAETFMPGPWRRFRLRRRPEQLVFDFDDELSLQ